MTTKPLGEHATHSAVLLLLLVASLLMAMLCTRAYVPVGGIEKRTKERKEGRTGTSKETGQLLSEPLLVFCWRSKSQHLSVLPFSLLS